MSSPHTEVEAQEVQLYYNTASKNYSLEFFIKNYKKQTAPDDKVVYTTSYEAIQKQAILKPAAECVATANHNLYFDITIETNQQDLSEDDTEYTVTVELPELIQGKQENNTRPTIHVQPTVKLSGTERR